MKGNKRRNIIKMLIVALGVCAIFGTAVIAYADNEDGYAAPGRDIVGRGTAIEASAVPTSSEQTPQLPQDPKGSTTTAVDAVNTGMFDQLYPFVTMLAINFLLFALFVHLRLNQARYGRNQTHYREIDDFHWRMRHLDD